MSVRRRTHRYKSGRVTKRWNIDVKFTAADGTIQRIREVAGEQTRAGAERQEREIRHRLENPSLGDNSRKEAMTLAAFWPIFYKTHVLVNNKLSEASSKEKIMRNHLLPRFGEMMLERISVLDVEKFKAELVELDYKNKTVNNCLTVLRTVLNTAVAWDFLAKCPVIKLLRVGPQEFRFLGFEEAQVLIAACTEKWRPMVVFALNTGLRIGELLALRWTDLDLQTGLMRVRFSDWEGNVGTTKSGKVRDVPLNDFALGALDELQAPEGLVFCHDDGRAFTYRQANYALEVICRGTKLGAMQWHTLRHTFASHLAMRGVSLSAIQKLLGHTTQAMTERYAHLSPHVSREAVMSLVRPKK